MNYLPLVIIGAARSGTNILRDTLTAAPGISTWPCDEINLIWRHGNLDKSNDVFASDDARPDVSRFIRRAFDAQHRRSGASIVVEKTCANSLRVPFIDHILPEARYIYIVRDGRDASLSATKRWTASVEPAYLLKKMRFAPISDVPHYAARFIRNRLHQRQSRERRQSSWGPRFPDMDRWVAERPLIDVCANQWAASVAAADAAFARMPPEKVVQVSYEGLVSEPREVFKVIGNWLGQPLERAVPDEAFGRISDRSAGGWRKNLAQFTSSSLELMKPVLVRHGYGEN